MPQKSLTAKERLAFFFSSRLFSFCHVFPPSNEYASSSSPLPGLPSGCKSFAIMRTVLLSTSASLEKIICSMEGAVLSIFFTSIDNIGSFSSTSSFSNRKRTWYIPFSFTVTSWVSSSSTPAPFQQKGSEGNFKKPSAS